MKKKPAYCCNVYALLLPLFLLVNAKLLSQSLKVLSSKDSLPLSFATIHLKGKQLNCIFTTNADGDGTFNATLNDTAYYTLSLYYPGFEKNALHLNGMQLRTMPAVFLIPANTNLGEVVVTAQYVPLPSELSIQKVKVITREKIDRMAAVNLADVLGNQLNVRLQQDNILGSGMNLQGVSGNNVKILVDGVPVIGRLNGNIDLSQINLNDVEKIELVEGPLSVQYGTNALAGTINIITRKGGTKKFDLALTPYYESVGTYNLVANAGFTHKKYTLHLSTGRNFFDGWNNGEALFTLPRAAIADSLRYKQWKPKEQYFANLSWSRLLKKGELRIKSVGFNESILNRGYPRAPYVESAFDDYYYTQRIDNSVSFAYRIHKNWNLNALGAYNYYKRIKKTVYKDLTTLSETITGTPDQDTSRFNLLMSRASFIHSELNSKFSFELGYDLNYESTRGKRISKTLQFMGDYALFVTGQYNLLTGLAIKPGLRYAYNTVYNTPLVPSLNVKYDIKKQHTIRSGYAMGFRAPTLKELYFLFVDINHNIIGSTGLKAEQSHNYSLSYNYTGATNKLMKLDISTFYNSIFNLITLAQVSGTQYSYINVGRYKTLGAQLLTGFNIKQLTLQAGVNYTGRYNQLAETSTLPRFSYSPEALFNSTYNFKKLSGGVSAFYKYTGRLPGYVLVEQEIVQTSVSGYSMLDFTAFKSFNNEKITVTAGCKNIFNVRNINSTTPGEIHSTSSTSMPLSTGRNYFVKLNFNFKR